MSDTASAAPRVPKRVAAVILNSLKGGVVPRIGLPYITVGREVEIRALLVLMERDRDMKLFCTAPHEEQSTKWAPYLRERYFKMLENCTRTEYAVPFPQTGAQLLAYKRIIDLADMMLTVFDTEALPTGRTEDHALFYAINQHKPVFNLDPYALTMTRIDELGL